MWLKKYIPDKKRVINSTGKLGRYIHHPAIWRLNAQSVSRGIAVGLFTACVPIMPFQTLLAIFLSIILQANFAIAFAVSWVSNPLTLIPITYFTYLVGVWVLGESHTDMGITEFNWQFDRHFWSTFTPWMQQFGKAFFVGLPIVAFSVAIIGYLIAIMIWRGITLFKDHHQRK